MTHLGWLALWAIRFLFTESFLCCVGSTKLWLWSTKLHPHSSSWSLATHGQWTHESFQAQHEWNDVTMNDLCNVEMAHNDFLMGGLWDMVSMLQWRMTHLTVFFEWIQVSSWWMCHNFSVGRRFLDAHEMLWIHCGDCQFLLVIIAVAHFSSNEVILSATFLESPLKIFLTAIKCQVPFQLVKTTGWEIDHWMMSPSMNPNSNG